MIDSKEDEVDLLALFGKVWWRRWMITGLSLMMAALVMCFHLLKKSVDFPEGYQFPIMFTFAGAQQGTYPNGERFVVEGLLANEVLLKAAREAGVSEEIIGATDIRLGNGLTASSVNQIAAQLRNENLADSQVEALEAGLERVQGLARQYAVLQVNMKRFRGEPEGVKAYLREIPRAWSDRAVSEMGVLEVEHQAVSNAFVFDPQASLIKEVFRFEGYLDLLERSIMELGTYGIANLSAISAESGQRLSEIRLNLNSVRTEFNDLVSMIPYAINGGEASSDRISESLLAAKRLNLELERERLQAMVAVYDESLALLSGSQELVLPAAPSNEALTRGANASALYSPQLSDQMFNSLLELGKTVSDSEQRAAIINKRIEVSEQIQNVNLRLARLSNTSSAQYNLLDKDGILTLLAQQTDAANFIQGDVQSISQLVSQQVLGATNTLWQGLGPVSELSATSAKLTRVLAQVIAALVFGLLVGLFLALVLPWPKSKSLISSE
ncbi:hypothetical protein [Motiliproteus sediminis]|uniref:hypothetical protein n=1 Tax=Motiliproteus sediminis TaxID=1468178 RepID=UPI001AEFCB20|nr:hypothetical protein [Motiliproteus sediminis]